MVYSGWVVRKDKSVKYESIRTIDDIVKFIDEAIGREKEGESPADIAWSITGLINHDAVRELRYEYPNLQVLLESAADLEVTEKAGYMPAELLWGRIKRLNAALAQQAKARKVRYNKTMNNQILSDDQIEAEVAKLDVAWSHIPGEGLVRVFETQGFADGLLLVEKIGGVAERQTHYPEVTLRSDEVDVTAFTSELGGVTMADVELAKAIDEEL